MICLYFLFYNYFLYRVNDKNLDYKFYIKYIDL